MSKNTLPELIDRAIFFDNPEITGAQLSPDGKYISFHKPYSEEEGEKGESNIWIKKTEDAFSEARPVTKDKRPIPAYFWTHDSKYILYVQDLDGDENYHVYAIDINNNDIPEPRALTHGEGVLAMLVSVPQAKPNLIYVGLNDRDPQFHDLYEVRIKDGKRTLIYENKEQFSSFSFDNNGNFRIASKSNDAGGSEIYLHKSNNVFEKIYDCTVDESSYIIGFNSENTCAYIDSNKGNIDKSGLFSIQLETKEIGLIDQDPEDKVDFSGFIQSRIDHKIIATYYISDKRKIYWRDAAWESDFKLLESKFPDAEISIGSMTADEQLILVDVNTDTDPGTVYLFDRKAKTIDFQYRPRPNLPSEILSKMTAVSYPSSDGLEIPAYLTLPHGLEAKDLPLIMYVHGGPWARDTWGYNSFTQFLANRGYAVLQANFRASTGFGKAFLNAGNGEWGLKMQDDITYGVKYLVDKGIVDPKRVGIMGGSYGGYATLAGVAFTPNVYAAGVSIVGPSNLNTLLDSIPPYWESFKKRMYVRMANPETEEGQKWLTTQSPLFSAEKITAPLLIAQGANDPRVKQAESDQIVSALHKLNRDVEYLVAPDEGHGFRRPENNQAMIAAIEKFFAKHLNGRFQSTMEEPIANRLKEITVDPANVKYEKTNLENINQSRPKPAFDLTNKETTYNCHLELGPTSSTFQIIEKVEIRGDQIYIQAKTIGGIATEDEVILEKSSLSPVKRKVLQAETTITIDYTENDISGTINKGNQKHDFELKLNAPLFADGPSESYTIANLDLEVGFKNVIWRFDLMTQKVQQYILRVPSKSFITINNEKIEVFDVEILELNSSNPVVNYSITTGHPRSCIQKISKVPGLGGAMLTQRRK